MVALWASYKVQFFWFGQYFIRTKLHSDLWNEDKFRKHIFQKCYLSDNVATNTGTISMDDLNKRRQERIEAEKRAMGYFPF